MSEELESLAGKLEQTGDYRVLRRLRPRSRTNIVSMTPLREAIVLDVETTGLDARRDEIIELAMARFAFSDDGHVLQAGPTFQRLRQPSFPIPSKVISLTGITNEIVAGHTIDPGEIANFIAGVELVIAHHAKFDRPFAESLHPGFAATRWACSMTQVEWELAGCEGRKLSYLLASAGLFHESHRGLDDCHATLELLARPLGETRRTALAYVVDEAARTTWRLRAVGASYARKDLLRSRGYRWNNGDDGHARAWFIDLQEDAVDDELEFLRAEVFGSDWQPDLTPITAQVRFSDRV